MVYKFVATVSADFENLIDARSLRKMASYSSQLLVHILMHALYICAFYVLYNVYNTMNSSVRDGEKAKLSRKLSARRENSIRLYTMTLKSNGKATLCALFHCATVTPANKTGGGQFLEN